MQKRKPRFLQRLFFLVMSLFVIFPSSLFMDDHLRIEAQTFGTTECGNSDYSACLYIKQVIGDGYHSYVLIKVKSKEPFLDLVQDSRFISYQGYYLTTISGQPQGSYPSFGNLQSVPSSDIESNGIDKVQIAPTNGDSIKLIRDLFNAEKSYGNNLKYAPIPLGTEYYNSNSFIRGILEKSNLDEQYDSYGFKDGMWLPGWGKSIFGQLDCAQFSDNIPVTIYKAKECQTSEITRSFTYERWINLKDEDPGFEDNIKSIRVKEGWSVKVYQHYLNYGEPGVTRCVMGSLWDLSKDYFDNSNSLLTEISSFKIYANNNCTEPSTGGGTNQGDSSDMISDVTIPDGTTMPPNNSFTKVWRIKNNGTTTWNSGYKIAFQSGFKLGASNEVSLSQNVTPGSSVDIPVNMISPSSEGTYRGNWILKNSSGNIFGDLVWVEIKVQNGSTPPVTSGQVKLYRNVNFVDLLNTIGVGESNAPSGNAYSMEIPTGWSVRTYANDGFSGQEKCWYQSVPNLQDFEDWQNKIQSIKVYNYYACGGSGDINAKVKLYSNTNYQNLIGEYGPGKTQDPNRNSFAMSIPSGWSVKTYRDNNYGGGERCWTSSAHNLQDHSNWQLAIDSMEVFTSNVCPQPDAPEVRVYNQTGYNGTSLLVTSDIRDLGATPIGDNNLKSFKIAGDWVIVLYEHQDFQGGKVITNSGMNDTGGVALPWGNGTSSIRIRSKTPNIVELYDLGDYNGEKFSTDRSLQDMENWDWRWKPESIRVKEGYEALICTDWQSHGTCGRLKGNKADLNGVVNGVRGNVGSIQICANECPSGAVVPTLLSPLNEVNYLPGASPTFIWNGNGTAHQIELWGGGLASKQTKGWNEITSHSFGVLPTSSQPYYWRVRGHNSFGDSAWSPTYTFYVKDTAPQNLFIFGDDSADLNTNTTLTAYVNPADATNLVYTWNPSPAAGQGSATATYNWSTPGIKTVNLTVSNTGGSVEKSHIVTASCSNNRFTAEYFNNITLTGDPSKQECLDSIDSNWGTSGPADIGITKFSGNGQDGDLSISTNITDSPIDSAASGTINSTTLNATNANFIAGQKILIHQTQGPTGAGTHQMNEIVSYSNGVITLKSPLNYTYTSDSSKKAQVLVTKQYNNVTIQSGTTLTAKSWNGTTGGIISFFASGEVNVLGTISANGSNGSTSSTSAMGGIGGGFRGGSSHKSVNGDSHVRPYSGEGHIRISIIGDSNNGSNSTNGNGGSPATYNNGSLGRSGAGGGNGTPGTAGTASIAGIAYGTPDLSILPFGGGGGGGGKGFMVGGSAGSGGSGGGIVLINSNKINIVGNIKSDGGNGGSDSQSSGGGGAGGSVLIKSRLASLGANKITVNGGSGGGNGGLGRIAIQYCDSYTGSTNPFMNLVQTECSRDKFSARYTKTENLPSGNYTFTTTADDGVRLWINEDLVIDNWADGLTTKTASLPLNSGNHTFRLEYYENSGDAQVKLSWTKDSELNYPPVVTQIPDQTIAHGSTFTTFDLDDYVNDSDPGDTITWSYSENTKIQVKIDQSTKVVTLTYPFEFAGEETITFTAKDSANNTGSTSTIFKVNPTNTPKLEILSPGTNNPVADQSFIIKWKDADHDSNATIKLYATTSKTSLKGRVLIADSISEDELTNQFNWITRKLTVGNYYIYAEITDGTSTVTTYSPGYIKVQHRGVWPTEEIPEPGNPTI